MQALLFDNFKVEIDKRAAKPGHCWHGQHCDGVPVNIDRDIEKFFYERTLEYEQPVVLDIGANNGVFSLIAAINPKMRVYAFEPTPSTYEILKRNMFLNNLDDRVRTFQLALADKKGTAILKYPKGGGADGLACIGNPLRFREWVEFEVPVSTVDDFVREQGIDRVDLIKIDTEGCDLLVLKGAQELIRKFHPGILCEYHEINATQFGYHPGEIVKLLTSWGYKHTVVSHEDIYFYMPGSVDSESALPDNLREYVRQEPQRLSMVLRELCNTGSLQEALTVVSYALEKYPDSPDLYNLQAELKYEFGDTNGAKEVLLDLVRCWPNHAKALSNLGVILGQEGDAEAALSYFIKSFEINPYDRNTFLNCASAALNAQSADKAIELVTKYSDKFPDDTEVQQLSHRIKEAASSQRDNIQSIQLASQYNCARKDITKIVITSGSFLRYNGGAKIYSLWVKLLRENGFDAFIATRDGSFEKWLVAHQPVISYSQVEDFRCNGDDIRLVTGWLDTPNLEKLIGDGQFYYFDGELKWTLHFRDKLDYYFNKGKIAKIATNTRHTQHWYMAEYGIKPDLIRLWTDGEVFYEDLSKRIEGQIGCMLESSPKDQTAFDFLERKLKEYNHSSNLLRVCGDEKEVADLLQTVDIFVGLNPGKHPFWGEACPTTQLEAQRCGCVLAAFDCLGSSEYLYDKWTGLIVPSGDVEALWVAVKFLLENPDVKEQLRINSKSISEGLFRDRDKYELITSFLELSK